MDTRRFTLIAAFAALSFASVPRAQESGDLSALREQLRTLEQQVKILSRQLELKEEAAAAAAPAIPKVTVNDKGLTLASADAANVIKVRGLVQLDNRVFFGDGGAIVNNAFVLRRGRLITEGQLARNYGFQLLTEFGGSSVSILDANFSVTLSPELAFKFGKFKSPVGLELLQSDSWTFFNERAQVTNLVPNRDLGVQAGGDLWGGLLSYQLGVFNGLADGASSTNADFDNEKEAVARLIAAPWRESAGSYLQGLSFGVAASAGRAKTASGRASGYRTDGQQTFFSYASTTISDGRNWRFVPQFDYRHGGLGLIGEYAVSTVNVRPSVAGRKVELRNRAWQVTLGYVLTGEDSSYNGVSPRTNFDWSAGTWGAFEVVGRASKLKVDEASFPLFASATSNAQQTRGLGLGLNWYLSKAVVLKADLYRDQFGFSPLAPSTSAVPVLRQDEKAFFTRFQFAF